ncbi:ATP-binding protein [Vibrio sp. SCSIO 43137]|uniref:ATP-binding protein n=1 Tax=Vibrio sp. SCSIO 43137 TaxID=3021011 RepID=UPI0023071C56|nr:ATP-binding protein [Vibrio sp. SCSIO 43137]WCE30573.1 ATP-binding protein [Vibrio sp. SCSIO 43137]
MVRQKRVSFIIFLLYLLCATLGGNWYWHQSYQQQLELNLEQLNRITGQLNSQLEKYAYIPQLLAKDRELIDALKNANNSAQIELTNRYLESVNTIIEAADTYLLNIHGTTIAASNWQSEKTFVGRNFAFRPYFQQAINQGFGQYFALGSTSGQRGFYYSFPVVYAAEKLGVVVVKTDITDIEQNWSSDKSHFIANDKNGVVFMASDPKWLYKSLFSLSSDEIDAIRDGRQYLDTPISNLNFIGDHQGTTGELKKTNAVFFQDTYLGAKKRTVVQPLEIRILTPKVWIFWDLFGFLVIVSLIFALILMVWLLIRHRQIKQRQIAQIEHEAMQKLEFQVMERTAELQMEIDEREKTEQALRQTQEELIQAAKLAVLGQMSASISHELNNPLAAIRSFAENGKRFLQKGQPERTSDNLNRISALTDRMAKISQQLKSLARKTSSDELVDAKIQPVIITTIELLRPQFRANQIQLEVNIKDEELKSRINLIQLEQVLINLLTNAMDELKNSSGESGQKREIAITLEQIERCILIHIDDNGQGLTVTQQKQLFAPFFTTKQHGLGLGLSISLQIMQAMQGDLTATDSPLGGARFTVTLPVIDQVNIQEVNDV